jgi:hypothetical protein
MAWLRGSWALAGYSPKLVYAMPVKGNPLLPVFRRWMGALQHPWIDGRIVVGVLVHSQPNPAPP